jgi:hypothetical protein
MSNHSAKPVVTLLILLVFAVSARAQHRVGRIIIIGNERTPDRVIRACVQMFPGQLLERKELQAAQSRLRACVWLVNEPGGTPSITILESDSEYKDLLIQVKDAKLACLFWPAHHFAARAAVEGGPFLVAGYWGPSRLHVIGEMLRQFVRRSLPAIFNVAPRT